MNTQYPRAYLLWNGQYKHIYCVGKSKQVTMFDGEIDMVHFRLSPTTRVTYSVEAKLLLDRKPRKARAR